MADPPDAPARRILQIELSTRTIAKVLAVGLGLWLIDRLWQIVLMVVVALIIVGTLNPVVEQVQKRGLKRSYAIALVFALCVAVAALVAVATVPSLVDQLTVAVRDAPRIQAALAEQLARHHATAAAAQSVRGAHVEQFAARELSRHVLRYTSELALIVGYVVTTIVLALYLLADRDRARGMVYAVVPRRFHLRLARILLNLETIVGGYVRGQLITSVGMTVFTFVVLTIFHVRGALALAVFAGVTDVLPFIGGLLATAPAVLATLPRGTGAAVVVLVALVVYQELESRVLIPKVYGKVLRLPSMVVVVALLIGGKLLGVVGALLALPIAAGVRMLVEELRVELPGDATPDAALRARDEIAEKIYDEASAGAPAQEAAAIATKLADELRHVDADTPEEAATVPVTGGLTGGVGGSAPDGTPA